MGIVLAWGVKPPDALAQQHGPRIFFGKGVVLLTGGLLIGWICGGRR